MSFAVENSISSMPGHAFPVGDSRASSRLEKASSKVFAKNRRGAGLDRPLERIGPHIQEESLFSVQEILDKHKPRLSITCREWRVQAAQYFDQIDLTKTEEERLVDSIFVLNNMSNSINSFSRVFTCKTKNALEAIALITDKGICVELELLATNPKNLVRNPESVKGSGTAFINFLFQKCITENKAYIELYSKPSSVEFYKRLGFFIVDTEIPMDEHQNIRMRIDLERIVADKSGNSLS